MTIMINPEIIKLILCVINYTFAFICLYPVIHATKGKYKLRYKLFPMFMIGLFCANSYYLIWAN